ncbi:M28 family peptidase [Candidatus Villigracilis saccharophilus]|uniref:M28 family peptidase n=1 Tax=Candidatus Villigracilis saccharophilus TaxID=3140684 RepID=UPI003135292F|nr:M28 family peptidase [Anaerolineales bacterium]
MNKRAAYIYLSLIGILLSLTAGWYITSFMSQPPADSNEPASLFFDGARAYMDVQTQVDFGPRIPGSEGHASIREWMRTELESAGWKVEIQEAERMGHPIYNVIAKRNDDAPQIILGAHYDTRMAADQDPELGKRLLPVPGANDGASGVAVLIEMARSLPKDTVPVWLVFFDAEDNGRIDGWDWILGSRAFAEELSIHPEAVVIVDMIGDADLNIYLEQNSNVSIRTEIWGTAEKLGYADKFINQEKFSMLDDHTPFLEAGIPAVDIIDFDYPYWHTTQDTPDKVSAESLQTVGKTLWTWIVEK